MRGFSLVELSIVLVILGLLTGGILTGQNLIRAAELRSVVTEYQTYQTALQTFRDKYFAIPGDMTNATSFWGDNASACADAGIADGSPGTCNGNGDGNIGLGVANATAERLQFWTQLALAGLIEGSYSGIAGPGSSSDSTLGENIPASRLSSAGWFVQDNTENNTDVYSTVIYGNSMVYGRSGAGSWPSGSIMTPAEAWGIDKKVDDGRPAYGRLVARGWNNTCAAADDGSSTANDPEASYRLSDDSIQCALIFPRFF
jgi:prepilin-type N-terminal cleavage/methylation domain-containing protein